MAIGVYAWRGVSGKITFSDARGEDGATILLVCEESANPQEPGAVFSIPDKAPPPKRGRFPVPGGTDAVAELAETDLKTFELQIDTSRMPGAFLPFAIDPFVSRAVELHEAGADKAKIDPDNAVEWGYKEETTPEEMLTT